MEKVKNYIKENLFYTILTLIFILVVLLEFRTNPRYISGIGIYKYLIYFVLAAFCLFIHNYLSKIFNKNLSVEKIFLLIAIPLGLIYTLVIPVGRVHDEQNHYYRAYDISRGNIFSKRFGNKTAGNDMPENIKYVIGPTNTYVHEAGNLFDYESKNQEKTLFSNTLMYAPVVYIPQSTGVFIGNMLHIPITLKAILGRIFNYAIWVLAIFFSIKLIPFKKYSLLFVSLLPAVMHQSVSLSADVVTNAVSFVFIAYVLNIVFNKKKEVNKELTKKQKFIICFLTIIISLCKFVYLPICLLLLLLPDTKFKNKKRKYFEISILALVAIIVTGLTIYISSGIEYRPFADLDYDFAKQISFVLHNPFSFIRTIGNTIISYGSGMVNGLTTICIFDVNVPLIYTYLIIIIGITLFLSESQKFKNYEMFIISLTAILTILLVLAVEYASWTSVGKNIIEGVQGRYFVPILIPLLLMFNNKTKVEKNTNSKKYAIFSLLMINICVLIRLFYTYI